MTRGRREEERASEAPAVDRSHFAHIGYLHYSVLCNAHLLTKLTILRYTSQRFFARICLELPHFTPFDT